MTNEEAKSAFKKACEQKEELLANDEIIAALEKERESIKELSSKIAFYRALASDERTSCKKN